MVIDLELTRPRTQPTNDLYWSVLKKNRKRKKKPGCPS